MNSSDAKPAMTQFVEARGTFSVQEKSWQLTHEHFMAAVNSRWYHVLVAVQDVITTATYSFFKRQGLRAMQLPITTSSVSSPMGLGSDSLPVKIDLFGIPTYLSDSMQFMLEYGCRFAPRGCYYIMPSFRGEVADSTHLNQFYHSEAEIHGGLDDVIALVERYVSSLCQAALEEVASDVHSVVTDLAHIERLANISKGLPRITMREAEQLLGGSAEYFKRSDRWMSITRQGEVELMRRSGGAVWLTDHDHMAVPFYQAYQSDGTARCADLLLGLGEVVGSGERHTTEPEVRAALARHDVDPLPYEWYARMKERYPLRTAGFGLGVERFVCWLLQHHDIRDCQLLPRFNGVHSVP